MSDRNTASKEPALVVLEAPARAIAKDTSGPVFVRASTMLETIGIPLNVSIAATTPKPGRRTLDESMPETEPLNEQSALAVDPRAPTRPDAHSDVTLEEAFRPSQTEPALGHFVPIAELGAGGMGRVVEAYDPELGRNVAIKMILESSAASPDKVARFVAEARLTAQLDHPAIVPVHEMGVSESGELFFVMKKVLGDSLQEVLARLAKGDKESKAKWGRHRLLSAFVQICNALAYAHERGVVHRDLKPENIMFGDYGEVMVMDWGVARVLGKAGYDLGALATAQAITGTQTQVGKAVGTPGYMSPEQARGEHDALTPKSDVWALGAILYEMLTHVPAYAGATPMALMLASEAGLPVAPRDRAPRLHIPEELERICLHSLGHRAAARPTARELAGAIQAYLEGARRSEEAARWVEKAQQAWDRHEQLLRDNDEVRSTLDRLEDSTPPWLPIEAKVELLEVRQRQRDITAAIEDAFEDIVTLSERALSHDRDFGAAHALLADAYWQRLRAADDASDGVAARHYAGRVRTHDRGRYAELLDGDGSVTLDTTPSGAEVFCQRVEREAMIWTLSDGWSLGRTPLVRAPLPMGSYVLTLSSPGQATTRYPVRVAHGSAWHAGAPVRLLPTSHVPEGWCYVPRGSFLAGGDVEATDSWPRRIQSIVGYVISALPVTCTQYAEWLNTLLETDPEEAYARSPREVSGMKLAAGQYWPMPKAGERFRFPLIDRDGTEWQPDWPAMAISWEDAAAFASWRTRVTGVLHRLPTELEWEKAARGADGRALPWGNIFDATLCRMRDSYATNTAPDPVGTYKTDMSVYGVRDLAGNVAEWCAEMSYRGDRRRRVARGGSWISGPRACRAASRNILDTGYVYQNVGFRLVRPLM